MRRLGWILGIVAALAAAVAITYLSVPAGNTAATHFDTIIVIGWPTTADGKLSDLQKVRVEEAVRELKAGRADHILFSGGPTRNQYVEADIMAATALTMGVPIESILIEDQAESTLGNIFFSHLIMQKKGWKTAEVISSPNHLPRIGVILKLYTIGWQTHPAPWPIGFSASQKFRLYAREIAATTVVRWVGFRKDDLVPAGDAP